MSSEIITSEESTAFTLKGFELAQRMATALSKSNMVPNEYRNNVANCLVALEMSQRMNVSPLVIMHSLEFIHGKPSWSAKYIIACINNSSKFSSGLEYDFQRDQKEKELVYTIYEWNAVTKKQNKPVQKKACFKNVTCVAFIEGENGKKLKGPPVSIEMARREGWWDKQGSKWQTMVDLMLMYRSATLFGRTYCPEVFYGMHTVDEVQDIAIRDITPQGTSNTADIKGMLQKQSEILDDEEEPKKD